MLHQTRLETNEEYFIIVVRNTDQFYASYAAFSIDALAMSPTQSLATTGMVHIDKCVSADRLAEKFVPQTARRYCFIPNQWKEKLRFVINETNCMQLRSSECFRITKKTGVETHPPTSYVIHTPSLHNS